VVGFGSFRFMEPRLATGEKRAFVMAITSRGRRSP
jgi:hypothetical protein